MNLFGVLEINASALLAERQRAEVVASNMANSETTRTAEGGPYRRQMVVFRSTNPTFGDSSHITPLAYSPSTGVEVAQVVSDPTPPIRRFDPSHPDADADGYVLYPAINPVQEMADLMGAVRAYQMNTSAVEATKNLIQMSLDLGRV